MTGGDHHDFEVSREELMQPLKPSKLLNFPRWFFTTLVDKPVTFFREYCVEPFRQPYPYYHRRYQRVPTIDKCELDDRACVVEANLQYMRDRMVDRKIVRILCNRSEKCAAYYGHDEEDCGRFCKDFREECIDARTNFLIKYGDLPWNTNVVDAFMKQKHRMLWERRHGPVGTGRDPEKRTIEPKEPPEEDMVSILGKYPSIFRLPKQMRP